MPRWTREEPKIWDFISVFLLTFVNRNHVINTKICAYFRSFEKKKEISSVENLVDACLAVESPSHEPESNSSYQCSNHTTKPTQQQQKGSVSHLTTQECSQQLDRLRYEEKCKVCLINRASVVLLPCRHLASCNECRESSPKCPICKQKVEKMIPSVPR